MPSKQWLGVLQMKLFDFLCSLKGIDNSAAFRREELVKENEVVESESPTTAKNIIANGEKHFINWEKVVTFKDDGGWELPEYCYRKSSRERTPTGFMAHWDVCLSSHSCYKVLLKRKLSVHFLIDNDGTIYQTMDTNHVAYHAGSRKVNNTSIGVEISNAYYPKYQKNYIQKGLGQRPVLDDSRVHGRILEPHLGFYPEQIKAFKALAKSLNAVYDIPLIAPMENNQLVETIYNDARNAKFKGVVSHYHITKRKIDCAGLRLDKILK